MNKLSTEKRVQILSCLVEGNSLRATAMCKAVGKQYGDYSRLAVTSAFLQELSRSTGIPVDHLAFTTTTGPNDERGTWVHPDVAINLGQWCSPKFAVVVKFKLCV